MQASGFENPGRIRRAEYDARVIATLAPRTTAMVDRHSGFTPALAFVVLTSPCLGRQLAFQDVTQAVGLGQAKHGCPDTALPLCMMSGGVAFFGMVPIGF